MEIINLSIRTEDVIRSVSREDAMDLILGMDLQIAEEDFTFKLIKNLISSMELDYTREEIFKILNNDEKFSD
jgi:hypothetical protein